MPFAFPFVRRSRLVKLAAQLRAQADEIEALKSDNYALRAALRSASAAVKALEKSVAGLTKELDAARDAAFCGDVRWSVIAADRLEAIRRLEGEVGRLRESKANYRAFWEFLRDAINDGIDAPADADDNA